MENKEIKINVPEGYEIDKENSTLECIKFKPIKNELPKTWEEFCETHMKVEKEYYVSSASRVSSWFDDIRDKENEKNLLPSKELAEAMLALCQLIQLRDCYNDGWEPDWTYSLQEKFCIIIDYNMIKASSYTHANHILAFKTAELRDQFFENFRDLIEIAKPLL